jgi:cytochrome P450 family 110
MKTPHQLSIPPLIQKLQWVFDPVGYMEKAVKEYPDFFHANVTGFGDNLFFIQDPEALQYILTNDRKLFTSPGSLNTVLQPLVGQYSVMMLDGDRHKQERKLLMPSFHGDHLQVYGELIEKLTKKILDRLTPNQKFTAMSITQKITIQVIMEVIFGLYEGERSSKIINYACKLLNFLNSPLTASILFFPSLQKDLGKWSPWGYFLHLRKQLDHELYAEISDRRANLDPQQKDILSLLLLTRDEEGKEMSDQEIRDELISFLLAGHDTTALAMAWALYWIHHHPEIKTKLKAELNNLGEDTSPMSIFRLPYLTAVCNETFRIHPVAMLTFPRVAQETVELLGHQFDQDAILGGCIYLLHQREDLYPDAKTFKPERFLERQYSPYEFMPFGGGVRRCMGEALAQFELKLVLATILNNYELELAETKPVKPQRRGVVLAPKGGVKMIFQRQLNPENKESKSTTAVLTSV